MFLAQLGLKAWFEAGLGGSAQQVAPEVAEAAFQAGNGLQLGLDMAWDVFLAIGTAMLAWNMRQHPPLRASPMRQPGLLLAIALLGLNLAAFPENPGRAGLIDLGPLHRRVVPMGHAAGGRPRCVGPRTTASHGPRPAG